MSVLETESYKKFVILSIFFFFKQSFTILDSEIDSIERLLVVLISNAFHLPFCCISLIFVRNLYLFVLLLANEWSWKMLERSTESPTAVTKGDRNDIYTSHEIIRSILFSMPCFHSTLKARFRFCYCCWPRYCNCSVSYSYVWFVFLLHSRNDSSRLLLFVTHSAHHSSICLDGWLVVCVFLLLILRIFYAKS